MGAVRQLCSEPPNEGISETDEATGSGAGGQVSPSGDTPPFPRAVK